MFIDSAKIKIKSGDGGKGCESYFRRTDKKTVPNGGDGGDGGDVIIQADRNESSLQFYLYRPIFEAAKGDGGSSNQMSGKKGASLILKVPCGTSIYNASNQFLIRDLSNHGDQVIAAKGGHGGAGNDRVRLATAGKPGEEFEIFLDYTLVADIFLVGTPNSGKSALLRAITGSKVKSETYPFSTRTPQLGTYETEKYDRLTICELPALERG
ncbi:MAG: 50S ribosome-binding GTPase [Candidatus Omnitrophica bacterium]|nr:50S ribosome-binding GTPase [Candidatus Omnitrophota bacterium]